jgi:NAD(P)-dependent dehydrogenase (short-subunit alcohol dehydrogenase family)
MEDQMSVALITGASRGLGRALARDLALDGWTLVVDARRADVLEAAVAELSPAATVVALPGDVADPRHRADLVGAIRRFGRLDLIVNNASVLGPSPQPAVADYADWVLDDVYAVNVFAPLSLIGATAPMLRASNGIVVNISSDAAVEAYPGWGGYGSAKAALDHATAILGVEEPSLHCYAFDPGDMRTDLHQQAFPGEDISDRPEPETVVPALRRLIAERPVSGRYRASELLDLVEVAS